MNGSNIAGAGNVAHANVENTTLASIRKEASAIIAGVVKLRHAEQEKRDEARSGLSGEQQTDYTFKLVPFDSEAPMPRPRGEPDPAGTIEAAYRTGLRFWAQRCAEVLTFEQWQDMAYELAERFKGEPIDPISLLENLFNGLETSDGSVIVS